MSNKKVMMTWLAIKVDDGCEVTKSDVTRKLLSLGLKSSTSDYYNYAYAGMLELKLIQEDNV